MSIPNDLKYLSSHEWVKEEDGQYVIGITDFAQSELSDIVFINLPNVGDDIETGGVLAEVESVKAVSDILSPVTGAIVAVNEHLLDAPELINEAPYDAWIARVADVTAVDELLTAEAYAKLIESERA
ncbi:MAG: glycine cleavage system protein GcvH [Clostridiales bacterium]|jgi:glycine cleavage system H protein|nr:glycine cleavage system protein GcvH [Clostridiales bacterium]